MRVGARKAGAVGQGVTAPTRCCKTFGYGLRSSNWENKRKLEKAVRK